MGHSQTGEIDSADGIYHVFGAIKRLRDALPRWVPWVGFWSGQLNMVPVDWCADVMDHLIHADGLDGRTFHVVDPDPPSARRTFNLFADAAGAPRIKTVLGGRGRKLIPGGTKWLGGLGSVKFFREQIRDDLGVPRAIAGLHNDRVRYGTESLEAALAGTHLLPCPPQHTYAATLWDYWLRHLDPDRDPLLRWKARFEGRTVLSSGVGAALAEQCAQAGAKVLLVARREAELAQVAARCGEDAAWYPVDLNDFDAIDALVQG